MEKVFTEELKRIFEVILISLASKNRLFLGCGKEKNVCESGREYYEFHLDGIQAAKNLVFLYDRDDLKNEVVKLSRLSNLDEINLIKVASCIGYSIAYDIENKIYVWGITLEKGVLIDVNLRKFELPSNFEIEYKIIDVQCGAAHALILTACGSVFAFGNNKFKQCGGETGYEYIAKPTKIQNLSRINSIACGKYHSIALGPEGVYGWGSNKYKQIDFIDESLCINDPKLLDISHESHDFNKICCGPRHTWILYDENYLLALGDNRIGQLGTSSKSVCINNLENYTDVLSHYSYDSTIAKFNDTLHIWGTCKIEDLLSEISFEELCNIISRKYLRLIENTSCLFLIYEYIFDLNIHCLNENRLTFIKSKFNQNGKHKKQFQKFDQNDRIGKGSFGQVYKVFSKMQNKYYALKVIDLNEHDLNEFLKEIITSPMILAIKSKFIITYYDIWLEETTISNEAVIKMYILMELVDFNLEDIIKNIQEIEYLFSDKNKRLTKLGFYMAVKLFIQILHGVHDLHDKNLIHRDLKPANIMIQSKRDDYSIKIVDFGLVAYHQCDKTCNVSPCSLKNGAEYYKAPEMKQINFEYTHKVDIYSLAIIFMELFTTEYFTTENLDDYYSVTKVCKRMKSFNNLQMGSSSDYSYQDEFLEVCGEMLDRYLPVNRPDCSDIIKRFEDILNTCFEEASDDFREVKDKILRGELYECATYFLLENVCDSLF